MTAGSNRPALDVDVDVIPVGEVIDDLLVGWWIGLSEVVERGIGEDDPPAERVGRAVPLQYGDVVSRIGPLQQQCQIQTRRSTPNNRNLQWTSSRCRAYFVPIVSPRSISGGNLL